MKKMKVLRALMIGVFASGLSVAIPASPALAAYDEEISVDPSQAEMGDYVDVEGLDFDYVEGENTYVTLYFAADEADPGDEIGDEVDTYKKVDTGIVVDSDGEFDDGHFKIPATLTAGDDDESVSNGTYYVYATYGDDEIVAVDELKVIGGEIEIDPDEGIVGTEVEITGTGFVEDEELTVEFDGSDVDIESGDDKADNDGEFEITILIPEDTAGDHTITVTGDEDSEGEATFAVEPEVTVSPVKAPPGDQVTISGTGFGNKAEVDITLCNVDFQNATETDSDGNFSVSLEVPDVADGFWDIKAEDEDGNDVTLKLMFKVEEAIDLTISPVTGAVSPGHVGQNVTMSGVAFKPNSQITITYASTPQTIAITTSDANGNFIATFPIPESVAGVHTITASDGTNSLQVDFYMESQAPDIPPLLLPLMGDKTEALPHFDWEDVTDDSGVTYTLQVATSEDFTPVSMVLVKEGLTASEYTVTAEEKLPSRSKDEPYYWRIKAVDGAYNESGWTGGGQFCVGFSLPGWTIHIFAFSLSGWAVLWWGLGCLAAGLGGYWWGKRQA